jgi:hypothetical protein
MTKLTMVYLLDLIKDLQNRIAELEKRNFHDDTRAKIKRTIEKSKD